MPSTIDERKIFEGPAVARSHIDYPNDHAYPQIYGEKGVVKRLCVYLQSEAGVHVQAYVVCLLELVTVSAQPAAGVDSFYFPICLIT